LRTDDATLDDERGIELEINELEIEELRSEELELEELRIEELDRTTELTTLDELATLDVLPELQIDPVTAGTCALPEPLLPCTPNSMLELGAILLFQPTGDAE